jgi:hypothetical protein
MNIHTSNRLVTAIDPTSRSPLRRGLVFIALALAALGLSLPAWADLPVECSAATLNGAYMGRSSGTLLGLPYTTLNRIEFDGNGSAAGSGTTVLNGVVSFPVITATYTVNSDCTGQINSVPAGLSQNFVIKDDGSQVFFITLTHPAGPATVSGEALRISKK